MKDSMLFSKSDQLFGKGKQGSPILIQVPVYPRDLIVLTPCIIISTLGPAKLISCQEHRYPLT